MDLSEFYDFLYSLKIIEFECSVAQNQKFVVSDSVTEPETEPLG